MFRRFTTQAAKQAAADFQVTTLSNGFVVASRESTTKTPLTRLSLAFGAGARHEGLGEQGVAHMLRASAFQSTSERSSLKIARDSEQQGTHLGASATREVTVFEAECLPENVAETVDVLADALTDPNYRAWEVAPQNARMELERDSAHQNPTVALVEEAHRLAFQKGLGNGLYAPEDRIGKVSPQAVDAFHNQRYAESRRGLVATGIAHTDAVAIAEKAFGALDAPDAKAPAAAVYIGGQERHVAGPGESTSTLLAYKGVARSSDQFAATKVLEAVIGAEAALKWGQSSSKLAEAASDAAGAPVQIEAVNVSYADAGIFGVVVHNQDGAQAGKATKAASAYLQQVAATLTAEEVESGKQRLAIAINKAADVSDDITEAAECIVAAEPVATTEHKLAAVSKVALKDVQAAAKALFLPANRNLVSFGNLSNIATNAEL